MVAGDLRWCDESDTTEFAQLLAAACAAGGKIYLQGELGKTTLVRATLHALGVEGAVRSPTYTLIEPYEIAGLEIFHLDLYRLGDPEELEFVGVRELDRHDILCFVEWPEKGRGFLPAADLQIHLRYQQNARSVQLEALSERGQTIKNQLSAALKKT